MTLWWLILKVDGSLQMPAPTASGLVKSEVTTLSNLPNQRPFAVTHCSRLFGSIRPCRWPRKRILRSTSRSAPPTLCRLENRITRKSMFEMAGVLVDVFLNSYNQPPEEITLDLDATDDPLHGDQEGRFFHGY